MKSALHLVSIAAAAMSHWMIGLLLAYMGRVHKVIFIETDSEVPLITKLVIGYSSSGAAMIVCLLLGLLTAVILIFVLRKANSTVFPFLLSISFVIAILHITTAAFAYTLPFMKITTQMGN